jgi:hypothetical protein
LPGARRQRDMGVTEQGADVSGRVRAHQPIGPAILETHILQPVEIAQQFLPFRRDVATRAYRPFLPVRASASISPAGVVRPSASSISRSAKLEHQPAVEIQSKTSPFDSPAGFAMAASINKALEPPDSEA